MDMRYGATFTVDRGRLTQIKNAEELIQLKNELAPETEQVPDANNSLLVDDNTSQKLSQADIVAMKEKGVSGKDVIKAIVGNSSTFHTKTDYSKEKYLKKKSKKHITTIQILRGTANTIWSAYYSKNPAKICNIRGDSLALLLNLSNVFAHPNKRVLGLRIVKASLLELSPSAWVVLVKYTLPILKILNPQPKPSNLSTFPNK